MKYLILLEPIFRGSRLQILFYTLNSLKNMYDEIYIITRKDYFTDHFKEFSARTEAKYTVVAIESLDLKNAWLKKLTIKEMKAVFKTLRDLINKLRMQDNAKIDVIFMALDDYFLPFVMLHEFFLLRKKGIRYFGIRYRILYTGTNTLEKIKQFTVITLLKYLIARKFKILVFDERVRELPACVKKGFYILPDPWEGPYSGNLRASARKRYNIGDDKFVISLIGRQNKRKGFSFILLHLEDILQINRNIVVFISGKIENQIEENTLRNIVGKYPERIIYIDRFLSEDEIAYSFAVADVILLPYSKEFGFSSGVLVRACATGVPVITTSHGLIGYRVKTNNIGLTFDYGNFNSLRSCLETIMKEKSIYELLKMGCKKFAENNTVKVFGNVLSRVME
ncbi:glycosyltransferase [Caldicellulosiruptor morganii]|nr:glycosyltransferase [Caldicellulosiruptor morganii]